LIQASPSKSNPKHKQKNLSPKTLNKKTQATPLDASSSTTFWYFLVFFGMFRDVLVFFERQVADGPSPKPENQPISQEHFFQLNSFH